MNTVSNQNPDPIQQIVFDIESRAESMHRESLGYRIKHQAFTITTILFGVIAPALVTYEPLGDRYRHYWKFAAILITASASASATIRAVLRFNEKYSNSALTSISLLELAATLNAYRVDIVRTVQPEYQDAKLFEFAAWGRRETLGMMRKFVEKEVSAVSQEEIKLSNAPVISNTSNAGTPVSSSSSAVSATPLPHSPSFMPPQVVVADISSPRR